MRPKVNVKSTKCMSVKDMLKAPQDYNSVEAAMKRWIVYVGHPTVYSMGACYDGSTSPEESSSQSEGQGV